MQVWNIVTGLYLYTESTAGCPNYTPVLPEYASNDQFVGMVNFIQSYIYIAFSIVLAPDPSGSDPCWGWFGSGTETTFSIAVPELCSCSKPADGNSDVR